MVVRRTPGNGTAQGKEKRRVGYGRDAAWGALGKTAAGGHAAGSRILVRGNARRRTVWSVAVKSEKGRGGERGGEGRKRGDDSHVVGHSARSFSGGAANLQVFAVDNGQHAAIIATKNSH